MCVCVCVFEDRSNFICESPPFPWWRSFSGKVSCSCVTYMWSWLRATDWGHDWAAGGLSVDRNGEASSALKPCIFKYFMTPSSTAPFIGFVLWLVAAFH